MGHKKFRVPDYDINLKSHELLVLNTPTFQRLFHVYQLGLAYLVYPFATHTRAAHAVEALNFAQRIITAIELKLPNAENKIKRDHLIDLIRMSALVHDIAHLPYSHTLEDENVVFESSQDDHIRVGKILDRLKTQIIKPNRKRLSLLEPSIDDYQRAIELIDKAKQVLATVAYGNRPTEQIPASVKLLELDQWFIADIIGNTFSADLLAYIKRDVEFTGIEKKHGGYRIYDYLDLGKDKSGKTRLAIRLTKAGLRVDVLSAILDILDIRYALMERVIFHHAKCAASSMLARAARLKNLTETDNLYSMGDEGFLQHLRLNDSKSILSDNDKEAIIRILDRLDSRTLYKRIYRVTMVDRVNHDKTNQPFCDRFRNSTKATEFENQLEDHFGMPRGTVSIFCPKETMHLKEAKVMVIWEKHGERVQGNALPPAYPLNGDDFKKDFPEFEQRIKEIADRYEDLWAFYVFIDPDEFGKTALIQKYLESTLGIKNDRYIDMYLGTKPQYRESLEIAKQGQSLSMEMAARAQDIVLEQQAAWNGQEETWPETVKMAYRSVLEGRQQQQETLPFSSDDEDNKKNKK